MFVNLLIYILFCSLFSVFGDGTYEICQTPEKQSGKCVNILRCPMVNNLLNVQQPVPEKHYLRLKELHCGFEGTRPKVCCDGLINNVSIIDSAAISHPDSHEGLSSLLPDTGNCGFFLEDRNVESTSLDGYPWMALLEYETPNGRAFHCGGALINERFILTAAHCVDSGNLDRNWKLVNVRLGEYDTRTNPDCDEYLYQAYNCCCAPPALNVGVKQVIIHENYNYNDRTRYSDIALIKMDRDVEYTEFIRPICLQPLALYTNKSDPGKSSVIGGWGYTAGGFNSAKKLSSRLTIRTREDCATKYSHVGIEVRDDKLCAFPRKGGDSCAGDSGGILMNDNHETITSLNYFALGIQSIANQRCTAKDYPIIYTRVETYIPWIIQKLK